MSHLNSEPHSSVNYFDAEEVDTAVIITANQKMDQLGELFDKHFSALGQAIQEGKITPVGPALARYTRMDEANGEADVQIGFPIAEPLTEPLTIGELTIQPATLPAGRTARITHFGPYEGLSQAWNTIVVEVLNTGHSPNGACYEVYVNEPTPDMDPADLRTDLYVPVD